MTHGSGIEIGRVSERDHTRHHAIVDGHAACGRGKILLHHVVPLTPVTAKGACRTLACRKAIRHQLDGAQAALDLTAWSARRRLGERVLIALIDVFRSPAEIAAQDARITEMRAHLYATTYRNAA